jgi:hypothetical protein
MRSASTKPPRRKRYFLVACFAVVITVGLTPAFQTWACRLALNQATAKQGLTWSVGAASIGLFPIAVELEEVAVAHAEGTDLHSNRVAISLSGIGRSGWKFDRIIVDGLEGLLIAPDRTTPSPSTPAHEANSLLLHEAAVSNVDVEIRSNRAAFAVEWERLSLEELHWDGTHLNGAVHVPQADVTPLPLSDGFWSGTWEAPASFEGLSATLQAVDSLQQFTLQTASNWGEISVDWHADGEQQTVAFAALPQVHAWPVRSDHWLRQWSRIATDSVIFGQFTWHAESGGTGVLSHLNVEVPLVYRTSNWNIGPIDLSRTQLKALSRLAGLPLPTYFNAHSNWQIQGEHDGTTTRARLTPKAASDQRIELTWDNRGERDEVSVALTGFALNARNQDLCQGNWDLIGHGHATATGWEGRMKASHPAGDGINTEWNATWNAPAWSISTESRIEQLTPSAQSTSPWELFAHVGWRASGSDAENWTQVLEIRDIVLLQNRVPRTFDWFDAVQSRTGEAWSIEWASAFVSGRARCNTALLTECSFNPTRLAFEPRSEGPSVVPQLNIQANVVNLHPIAVLADLPMTTREPFTVQARWNGQSGMVQTHVASASIGNVHAEHLAVNGTLHAQHPSRLNWEVGGLTFNNTPIIEETSGQLIGDTAGLALAIHTFTGQVGDEAFALEEPARVSVDAGSAELTLATMPLRSAGGTIDFSGAFQDANDWNLQAHVVHDGVQWGSEKRRLSGISGILSLTSGPEAPLLEGAIDCDEARWNDFIAVDARGSASGTINAPHVELQAATVPSGNVNAVLDIPLDDLGAAWATVAFTDLDLIPVNGLLPPSSIGLIGTASGNLSVNGFESFPRIEGDVISNGVTLTVPYLGTHYEVDGKVEVRPDGFLMDQWTLFDASGAEARFNGTVLHRNFKDWNLDFGIEISDRAITLMNIPITDDALFYGTASGTGDINVSGFGPMLEIDASLTTEEGTDFALPMDSQSDVDYVDFVRFKKSSTETETPAIRRGTFSNTRINLGIDVENGAQARIVFNRKVGDEIVGNATGHLDLEVNDFEQLDMTGNLEITEGAYHFTLQNWFNKRFDIQPGSTISWEGDPYDAQLNVATTFTTRAALDPLLPETDDLPGRIPVDLQLTLNGSLLRPGLDFNVAVPTADSRIQALVEGALVSEEEVQRQALGLLTLNQFIPSDPTEAAIGGFIQPAQSTQFLANQLGHWISQIAPAMDVGLDYAQDALSGEQAVGLALSTQLLNDRLHIEGEVGAQTTGTVNAEDFQIQDLTVSFDLTEDGGIQLTGHSRQNASLTNAIEGEAVQGVGIRFKWEFDEWGAWKNR